MSKNALHILKDEAIYKKFSSKALIEADKFHIDKILPIYEELYDEVVEKCC